MTAIGKGLTLIENNVATQIWASPDDIDLDNFVFGETYVTLFIDKPTLTMDNDVNVTNFPRLFSIASPLGKMSISLQLSGWVDSEEELNAVTSFLNLHYVVTQPKAYLILNDVYDYWRFPSPTGTRPYLPGWLDSVSFPFDASTYTYSARIVFTGVWS